jgi:glycogen debranching enzyme
MAKLLYNVRAYEDTTENWAENETVYPENSLLIDSVTGTIKKGNGEDIYSDLEFLGAKQALTWNDVTGIPAALTSAQAAGTASIRAIGTTATTAAAGNHDHAVVADEDSELAAAATIQDLAEALSARILNHDHAVVADVESGLEAADTIQDLAEALSARILALETAAGGGGGEGE